MGIMPDIIVARCDEPLEEGLRQKIALFCNVEPDCVVENRTLPVLLSLIHICSSGPHGMAPDGRLVKERERTIGAGGGESRIT